MGTTPANSSAEGALISVYCQRFAGLQCCKGSFLHGWLSLGVHTIFCSPCGYSQIKAAVAFLACFLWGGNLVVIIVSPSKEAML